MNRGVTAASITSRIAAGKRPNILLAKFHAQQ